MPPGVIISFLYFPSYFLIFAPTQQLGGECIYLLHPPKNYNNLDMETKRTDLYEAPATEVVEVKTEGIICESKPKPNYNPWDNQHW